MESCRYFQEQLQKGTTETIQIQSGEFTTSFGFKIPQGCSLSGEAKNSDLEKLKKLLRSDWIPENDFFADGDTGSSYTFQNKNNYIVCFFNQRWHHMSSPTENGMSDNSAQRFLNNFSVVTISCTDQAVFKPFRDQWVAEKQRLTKQNGQPHSPDIRDAQCPLPWCDSCRWQVLEQLNLMDSPHGKQVVGHITTKEVHSEAGRLYTTPIKGTVIFDHPPFVKGNIFYLLDRYLNDDPSRIWYYGKIYETPLLHSPRNEICEKPDKDCWWRIEEPYEEPELWLKVKSSEGIMGWISDENLICVGEGPD